MPKRIRKKDIRIALMVMVFISGIALWIYAGQKTQSKAYYPTYEILESSENYEVRRYPELTVAQVVVKASFEEGFEQATELLSAYRFGNNLRQPIEIITIRGNTTEKAATISQAWPLIIEEVAGEVKVSMILPEPFTTANAPRPKDPRVRIDVLDRQRIAVRPMIGSIDSGDYAREREALLRDLENSSLLILSGPRYAYYGPSWVFRPFRRGEVHVRVR